MLYLNRDKNRYFLRHFHLIFAADNWQIGKLAFLC
jgi:hypothetical protein